MNTKIRKITNKITAEDLLILEEAREILANGGLVVFPTETVYGLGGNGLSASSAQKIYEAKGRPSDNPLILHMASPSDAALYAVTSPLYDALAARFMPGPLTVVMPVRSSVPSSVTAGLSTVAVRCPAHPVAHALIAACGFPIAAPSANLSGSPSPTSAGHVVEDMDGRVDMILDGDDADYGVESTIVKIEDDNSLTLLRPGAITPEELLSVTDNLRIADAVLGALRPGETVLSPGMKYKHYAPATPTLLLDGGTDARLRFLRKRAEDTRIAALVYDEEAALYDFLPPEAVIAFGEKSDERMQAHRLFFLLREADKLGVSELYAPLPPTSGLGLALYNRMIRAAAHRIISLDPKENTTEKDDSHGT